MPGCFSAVSLGSYGSSFQLSSLTTGYTFSPQMLKPTTPQEEK